MITVEYIAELEKTLCKLKTIEHKKQLRELRELRQRQSITLATAGLVIERREGSRYWNLIDNGKLLCVTVYKRGALEVGAALAQARTAQNTQAQAAA